MQSIKKEGLEAFYIDNLNKNLFIFYILFVVELLTIASFSLANYLSILRNRSETLYFHAFS